MYFFNFKKENEWRLSLKGYLLVLEILGILMHLVLSPDTSGKDCVKVGEAILYEETSPIELFGPSLKYSVMLDPPTCSGIHETASAYQKTL